MLLFGLWHAVYSYCIVKNQSFFKSMYCEVSSTSTCVQKLMCLSTKAGVFNLAKGHKSMAPHDDPPPPKYWLSLFAILKKENANFSVLKSVLLIHSLPKSKK